jgi:hypothetical protein
MVHAWVGQTVTFVASIECERASAGTAAAPRHGAVSRPPARERESIISVLTQWGATLVILPQLKLLLGEASPEKKREPA